MMPPSSKPGDSADTLDSVSLYSGQEAPRSAMKEMVDRALIESIYDLEQVLVVVLSDEGNILALNRATEQATGYSMDELVGKNWFELMIPRERFPELWHLFQLRKTNHFPRFFENPIVTKTGREHFIAWQNDTLRINGKVIGTISFGLDISTDSTLPIQISRTRELFSRFFNQLEDVVWMGDGCSISYINQACTTLYGHTPEEFVARPELWYELIHPEDRDRFEEESTKLQEKGRLQQRYRIQRKDGSVRWVDDRKHGIFDETGNLIHLGGITRDITKAVHFEEALRASEHFNKGLIESMNDGLSVFDLDGKHIEVNKAFCRMTGYTRKELLGLGPPQPYWTNEGLDAIQKSLENTIQGIFTEVELEFKRKNGERFPVLIFPSLYRNSKGIISGIFTSVKDITDRKRSQVAMERSERRYRRIIETAIDGIWTVDRMGHTTFVNRQMALMLGYSKEEMIGKPLRQIVGDRHVNLIEADIARPSVEKAEPEEVLLRHKSGTEVWTQMNTSPLIDDVGEFVGTLAMVSDITARKKAEVEKKELAKLLRRSQKMETIGTLAGGIAHDFNNLLTPILGYAELSQKQLEPGHPVAKFIDGIIQGAQRAREMVEQILLFAKKAEKEPEPLHLPSIITEVTQLLRSSIPSSVSIRHDFQEPCSRVLADASQIHQIIVNLCTNAWQAMERSGGTITLRVRQINPKTHTDKLPPNLLPQPYVRMSVEDTGSGMAEAILDRIFEPFFTTKPVDKGTGLGLSVVHGIVKSHRGEIEVKTNPGEGTTFHIYLPALEGRYKDRMPEALTSSQGNESIIMVDDDSEILEMMKLALTHFGYKIDIFNDSLTASRHLDRHAADYDLMLTDLTMPNMNGLELAAHLKRLHSIPVIILTGFGANLKHQNLDPFGVVKVLSKPISIQNLASEIRLALEAYRHGKR